MVGHTTAHAQMPCIGYSRIVSIQTQVHSAAIPPRQSSLPLVQAQVGKLQGHVQSLTQQLGNAQANALVQQRQRLLAEHKLEQAQRQIAKLTQMLDAKTREFNHVATAQSNGKSAAALPLRTTSATMPSNGQYKSDNSECDGGSEEGVRRRAHVVDAAVQTEGVLLLPTALRAHGARVQQQLSRSSLRSSDAALSASATAAAAGDGGSAGEGGAVNYGLEGEGQGGFRDMGLGIKGTAAAREMQRRSNVLQRAKAQHQTLHLTPAPHGANGESTRAMDSMQGGGGEDSNDEGGRERDMHGGWSETHKTFFDDVQEVVPSSVDIHSHQSSVLPPLFLMMCKTWHGVASIS